MIIPSKKQAFVLRISWEGLDLVSDVVEKNHVIIGWGVPGLLAPDLEWSEFRKIISDRFYPNEQSLHRAGSASGHMWRFLSDMSVGDLVVVPHGSSFYVAEILGEAFFCEDSRTYRRQVKWLNEGKPIPRALAKSALVSRMKTYGTCARASDLVEEIEDCVELSETGKEVGFQVDLEVRLVKETLHELRNGRIESYGFEHLIKSVLISSGAAEAKVVARSLDKGADVLATFLVGGVFQQVVAVQAKHWQPEPPVGEQVVRELINGIEAEQADLGMIVTSGTIAESASLAADAYFEESGVKIELVDGEQFAKMIVEYGVGGS